MCYKETLSYPTPTTSFTVNIVDQNAFSTTFTASLAQSSNQALCGNYISYSFPNVAATQADLYWVTIDPVTQILTVNYPANKLNWPYQILSRIIQATNTINPSQISQYWADIIYQNNLCLNSVFTASNKSTKSNYIYYTQLNQGTYTDKVTQISTLFNIFSSDSNCNQLLI